ncbi:acyltransferase [Candidatus Micrarchaeota archaeon]|nr:acyltransferase [Candidatus Micrarchaeota archaeon]
MRELQEYPAKERNSLWQWARIRNPLRTIINFKIIYLARYLPSLHLKNFLYRLVGAKIGKNTAIALGATLDIFYPELIEIGDNSLIGYNTTILTHEFLIKSWKKGRVQIGKNVLIGSNCLILPGVKIRDNATVAAFSLVNKDVPANAFAAGVPAKILKNKF